MNGFAVSGHTGFLEGFRKSGVSVAGTSQIFRTGSVLDTNDSFRDHFSSSRTNDMGSQQLVSLLVSQNFDHSVSIIDSFGSGVGQEGERSLGVLDVCVKKCLLLALSYSSV